MTRTARLTILERDAEYAIATYGPVLLQLWENATPLAGAQAARRHAKVLAGAGFERTGSMVIVPIRSAMPETAARTELTEIPRELTNGAGVVLVQEGSGFRASAIRAVLSTMMVLSKKSMPHDVVSNVPAGCSWLADRVPVPGGARALCRAVAELRSLYEQVD